MTNEEALAYIHTRRTVNCLECIPEIGYGGSDMCDTCKEREAFNMAIAALEKQIPKKPNKNRTEYFCANCIHDDDGCCVGKNKSDGHKVRETYCRKCGQKIDWSEENDND